MTSGNNIETEFLELNSKQQWDIVYQLIRTKSTSSAYSTSEAIKPQNKPLNRYRDVSPYDHSRIVLNRGSTDYINANLVVIPKANRRYILTQGPLCSTVSHFWLMMWEQSSKAVLMLNKLVEKKQEKCYQYWPEKMGSEHKMVLEDVGLAIEYVEYQDYSHYLTRTFTVHDLESGDSRQIIQFHYTTWPDFGVPGSPKVFLEFLKKVRAAGVLEQDVGPAVVHCSAGIGRSGTFCLVDSCLVLIGKFGLNSVDVKDVLLEMRQYRMGLIQTAEQLRFSYQAIIEGAKKLTDECPDTENCNSTNSIKPSENNVEESNSADEEIDDEPPPLPPPRMDSLNNYADRPLPKIPVSTSLTELTFNGVAEEMETPPNRPLPVVPPSEGDEAEIEEYSSPDELEEESRTESPVSNKSEPTPNWKTTSPDAELRHRKRKERKEQLAAQVRDMKRRQQSLEKWTKLKRPKTALPD
ncbi:tyrosine-protein phosphatase non-receptor type 61F isoform X2 [Onthophagus taurus]|uniref:tyrosine-protein phosphatase non-receptor type 61F isoform X2 n=1 Tax=Onthophagus taurus TaxID=166361 RepID=UPI000C20F5A3|nr:tyrosine-protein phosphatase non-receptor type 61F isoform X2 [Onthophagus taurus]